MNFHLVPSRLQDIGYTEVKCLEMTLAGYFPNPAFNKNSIISYPVPQFPPPTEWHNMGSHLKGMQPVPKLASNGSVENGSELASIRKPQKPDRGVNFYLLPLKVSDEVIQNSYESYYVMLQQLRNQVSSPCSVSPLAHLCALFETQVLFINLCSLFWYFQN